MFWDFLQVLGGVIMNFTTRPYESSRERQSQFFQFYRKEKQLIMTFAVLHVILDSILKHLPVYMIQDRERTRLYDLTVSATNDASNPSLSSSTTVRVNVLDTNDEPPRFSVPSYNETISEGDKAGMSILKVSAQDKDLVSV